MDIKEILKFADDIVFTKTRKHLDDLQEAVLEGTWKGQTYTQIAEESGYSEGYIRDTGSELWKIMSDLLREDINKYNLRSALGRWYISNVSSNVGEAFVGIKHLNICADALRSQKVTNQQSTSHPSPNADSNKPQLQQDLKDAPDTTSFYDRISEQASLEQWITQEHCRLIAITGLSGIGKTALTLQLLSQIQHHFDSVIWRSLRTSPPLETTLKDLLQFLYNQKEIELSTTHDKLSLLIEYLRNHRCLIILDDVQTLLSSGQIAGNYCPEYENYSTFFRLIGETSHNSCIILNSWEPPREIMALKGENSPVRTLQLDGIGVEAGSEIFRTKGLLNEEKWQNLINTYRGYPLWLKIVATMIQELFQGRVAEFIKYEQLFLGEELKATLRQHFHRLSDIEKQVIFCLANKGESVSIAQLLEDWQSSPSELFNALQSLDRRSLIEKIENSETLFTLTPVVKHYVKIEHI